MVITFLGGWFEIFRDILNFLPPTLLAVEWEVRFAHFLYQKIFIAKKWPIFKHFFSQIFWPLMEKSPKKAVFSADFFLPHCEAECFFPLRARRN